MNSTRHIGERLTLTIFETVEGSTGQLLIMDPQLGDVMLATFKGETDTAVEAAAGRYLRELGRQCDQVPTVSSVLVRTDLMRTHDEADTACRRADGHDLTVVGRFVNPDNYDVLKVMVELEHEEPRKMHLLQLHTIEHEALGQIIDHASHAIGFPSKDEDPVSRQWREKHEPDVTDDAVREEHRAAVQAGPNTSRAARERYGAARRERRSRSRGKRAT